VIGLTRLALSLPARTKADGWVLADASGRYQPGEWAKTAISVYRAHKADRIVAEVNNGGDMVEATLRDDRTKRIVRCSPRFPREGNAVRNRSRHSTSKAVCTTWVCSRSSRIRCVHLLPTPMATFSRSAGCSPDRVDALVWALTDLLVEPMPGEGIYEVYRQLSGQLTGNAKTRFLITVCRPLLGREPIIDAARQGRQRYDHNRSLRRLTLQAISFRFIPRRRSLGGIATPVSPTAPASGHQCCWRRGDRRKRHRSDRRYGADPVCRCRTGQWLSRRQQFLGHSLHLGCWSGKAAGRRFDPDCAGRRVHHAVRLINRRGSVSLYASSTGQSFAARRW